MLRMRLRRGSAAGGARRGRGGRADVAVADGLLERRADRLVLTDRGRLLADGVVRDVLD